MEVTLRYEDIKIKACVFLFSQTVQEKRATTCGSMQGNFYGGDDSVADAAQLQRKV